MATATLIVSFPDATPAQAEQLAKQLMTMLREEFPKLEVVPSRSDPHAQSEPDLLLLFAQTTGEVFVHHATVFAGAVAGTALFETLRHAAGPLGTKLKLTHQESNQSGEIHADGTLYWPPVP